MSDNQPKKQILTENLPAGGLSHDEFRNRGMNLPANAPQTPVNLPQVDEDEEDKKKDNAQ